MFQIFYMGITKMFIVKWVGQSISIAELSTALPLVEINILHNLEEMWSDFFFVICIAVFIWDWGVRFYSVFLADEEWMAES